MKKSFAGLERKRIDIKTIRLKCKKCNRKSLTEKFGVSERGLEKYQCPYCLTKHQIAPQEADKNKVKSVTINFTERDLTRWVKILWEEATGEPPECGFNKDFKDLKKKLLKMFDDLKG